MRKSNLLDGLAIILSVAFIGFLIYASTRVALNFDASYNLLSYQSLFNGTGFNYSYGGQIIPLDPSISTGPELYFPAFVIWKLTGTFDYFVTIYVLVAYYVAFIAFLLWAIPSGSKQRLIILATFLMIFFSLKTMFDGNSYIDPLGEIVASFMFIVGMFLLHKRNLFAGAIILGFALDVKSNIAIALFPTLLFWFLVTYAIPYFRRKQGGRKIKLIFKLGMASILLVLPTVFFQIVLPKLILNPHEQTVLSEARIARKRHVTLRAFGQLTALRQSANRDGWLAFTRFTQEKFETYLSFFNNNRVAAITSLLSVLIFFILAKSHFSRYYFLFSFCFLLWWFFASLDPWYRYLLMSDVVFALGAAILLASLIQGGRKISAALVLTLILIAAIPRFSAESITHSLSREHRDGMIEMQGVLKPMNERQIFTYGWFQCPQMMILTNKRWGDYLDKERVEKAEKEFGNIYFLTAIENDLIKSETTQVTRRATLIKSSKTNSLYRIKP